MTFEIHRYSSHLYSPAFGFQAAVAAAPVCGHLQQNMFYFIKIFYCPIERASKAPVLFPPIGAFIPSYSGAQGRAVLYDNIVYQNNTISPSFFPAPLPSEEVGGVNTKLFSELKIFHVWIDVKSQKRNSFKLLFAAHFFTYLTTLFCYSPTGSDQ